MISQPLYQVALVALLVATAVVEGGQFISFANSDFEIPPTVQEKPKLPMIVRDRERLHRLCRFLTADKSAGVMDDKIKKSSVSEALSICSTLFGK